MEEASPFGDPVICKPKMREVWADVLRAHRQRYRGIR
jgi:hypothetical protein